MEVGEDGGAKRLTEAVPEAVLVNGDMRDGETERGGDAPLTHTDRTGPDPPSGEAEEEGEPMGRTPPEQAVDEGRPEQKVILATG